jgi:hypothetical protein
MTRIKCDKRKLRRRNAFQGFKITKRVWGFFRIFFDEIFLKFVEISFFKFSFENNCKISWKKLRKISLLKINKLELRKKCYFDVVSTPGT